MISPLAPELDSAAALTREFPVNRQAIAKHLAVLCDAALVQSVPQGRELTYLARRE